MDVDYFFSNIRDGIFPARIFNVIFSVVIQLLGLQISQPERNWDKTVTVIVGLNIPGISITLA